MRQRRFSVCVTSRYVLEKCGAVQRRADLGGVEGLRGVHRRHGHRRVLQQHRVLTQVLPG